MNYALAISRVSLWGVLKSATPIWWIAAPSTETKLIITEMSENNAWSTIYDTYKKFQRDIKVNIIYVIG